uniref:Uncharacterized protein n=1 Tax=Anguilla anguilla TaxID=7936 RepID=A0A0E9URK2_ANGAN
MNLLFDGFIRCWDLCIQCQCPQVMKLSELTFFVSR